jgi:hypothetical protein
LILVPAGLALWNQTFVPWVQLRLEQAIGHRVRMEGLAIGGLRTLVARGVDVFGAPPFDSEPLLRAERVVVRLGGRGRGFWDPAEVMVDGLDVEYLRTETADNLSGQFSPGSAAPASGAKRPSREASVMLSVRRARIHGNVVLPGGIRVAFRAPDASFQRSPQGKESASLRDLVLDVGAAATLRLPEVAVEHVRGAPVSAIGRRASLVVPGGGVLVEGAALEARFSGQTGSIDLRTDGMTETSPGLHISCRAAADVADLQVNARDLSLRALGVISDPRGVGLDDARADLSIVASLDMERMQVPFQIDGRLRGVQIHHPAVDRTSWRDLGMEIQASGQVAPLAGRIDVESADLRTFGAQLTLKGWVEFLGTPRGEISLSTPPEEPLPCDALLAAQPQPVRQALDGLVLGGKLGISLGLSFDAAAWETLALNLRVNPRCTVKTEPQILARMLPTLVKGTPTSPATSRLPLGKYHPDFAPLAEIPRHLAAAFLTSEDSRFFSHNGFDLETIRHALVQDFETGTFGRGASTITQQLAKNLFLTQHRTLARKLEETILTWRLHNLLGKERILELYLNVIDLGPGIRGVRQAARTYFGKEVGQLRPVESAHLAALTPNPHVLARRFRDGQVDDGWLQRLRDLLGMMKRSGRLTPDEFAAARGTKPALRKIDKDFTPRPGL